MGNSTYSAFAYKAGSSWVHGCPPWIKILMVPTLNIAVFLLPVWVGITCVVLQFLLALSLKFSLQELYKDVSFVLYYGFLLILVQALAFLFEGNIENWRAWLISQKETGALLIKLVCVMQSVSIMFKTSTSLEMREGIGTIESKLTGKYTFTDSISMFISFIPMIAKNWQQAQRAWIARGGKKNIPMVKTLLPVLFFVGMKSAYNKARAVTIRKS